MSQIKYKFIYTYLFATVFINSKGIFNRSTCSAYVLWIDYTSFRKNPIAIHTYLTFSQCSLSCNTIGTHFSLHHYLCNTLLFLWTSPTLLPHTHTRIPKCTSCSISLSYTQLYSQTPPTLSLSLSLTHTQLVFLWTPSPPFMHILVFL